MGINKITTIILKDGQPYEINAEWDEILNKPHLVTLEELLKRKYQTEDEVKTLIESYVNGLPPYEGEIIKVGEV